MNSTPRKVLRRAYDMGAHGDCIAAGASKACPSCTEVLMAAFDGVYGDVRTGVIDLTITQDLAFDRGLLFK